jgi:regulatory protein
MLSRRDLSEGEIRERLSKKGFPHAESSATIRRLRELGLVDDAKLCARLVRSYRETRGYGSAKIAWALRGRGFLRTWSRNRPGILPGEEELAAASAALRKKFRAGSSRVGKGGQGVPVSRGAGFSPERAGGPSRGFRSYSRRRG